MMDASKLKTKRTLQIVCAFVFVVGLGVYLYNMLFPPTLKEVALHALGCIEREDAGCLMSTMDKEEVASVGVDAGKLHRFLTGFFHPRMAGFRPSGDPAITPNAQDGSLEAQRMWKNPDGRTVLVSVEAHVTGDGIKAVPLITHLFIPALQASIKDVDRNRGPVRWKSWAEATLSAMQTLTDSGISGYYEGGHGTTTWREWVSKCEKAYQGESRARARSITASL